MLTNHREIKLVLTKAVKPTGVLKALFYFRTTEEIEIGRYAMKKTTVIEYKDVTSRTSCAMKAANTQQVRKDTFWVFVYINFV